jgi:V/A-type H+-transporting ATPase subunit D
MAKVRLTKTELKRQKDALKRFNRYLPTLVLKKQQLQVEILRVQGEQAERRARIERELEAVRGWVRLLGDPVGTRDHEDVGLEALLQDLRLAVRQGNIAGIDIPLFQDLEVTVAAYDLFTTPLWVDAALEAVAAILKLEAEIIVLEEQQRRLAHELRVTSQRVNLFEKIKIPETRESIRRIGIYLGDQQTAAVVRGKISKGKLVGGRIA